MSYVCYSTVQCCVSSYAKMKEIVSFVPVPNGILENRAFGSLSLGPETSAILYFVISSRLRINCLEFVLMQPSSGTGP